MARSTQMRTADAFAEHLLDALRGAFEVASMYLGDELGYYAALRDGPLTAGELAASTATDERYAREWCEAQVVTGFIAVEDTTVPPDERRFVLPEGYGAVLVDEESPDFLAPLGHLFVGALAPIGQVVEAYRTGEGVPYEAYGETFHEGQARINRPAFCSTLGEEWLPALPDVDARLQADPPARVADVGCGYGWSAIGIARAYPNVRVDGYDIDAGSVAAARENVREAGLADRVTVHHADAADAEGEYDLVTAFECVHDLSDPVGVLSTLRELAGDDGTVLVADERVGDAFGDPTDVEDVMYGWSVLHCLPVGRADHPSAATGTVMRRDTLREYAERAGFERFDVLPIDDFFFRFYRLGGSVGESDPPTGATSEAAR